MSPAATDFGLIPLHQATTLDQDILVVNPDIVPVTISNFVIGCNGVVGTCTTTAFSIQAAPYSTCTTGLTLAPGESCVINVVFNPTGAAGNVGVKNAALQVTGNAVTQTVALTGHDTIATLWVAPPGTATPAPGADNAPITGTQVIPSLNPATRSTVAVTGTITLTNTLNPCNPAPAVCPAGGNVDAGPILPTAITVTPISGGGTWAVAGSCAVGTPINAGGTLPTPDPGSSCTITLTYTPPAGATGTALNGSANLTVQGYGRNTGTNPTTLINATYTAN